MIASTKPLDAAMDPGRWVDDHGDYLLSMAMLRLRDRPRAEDVVQEALVTALQSRGEFRGDSSVRTWLTGILRNKILEAVRKRLRNDTREDGYWNGADPDYDERGHLRPDRVPAAFSLSPGDSLEQLEFLDALSGCLDELPDRVGQAFLAIELDGHTLDQVAETLTLKKENLYVLLHRARKKLRTCLERNWFQD